MADRVIYIDFEVDGVPTNVYSVKLSSSDDTYGIKDQDDTIIVADNTTATNTDDGRYEYTIDTETGVVYFISWEIIKNLGDDPIYKEEQIGPFSDFEDNTIRAIADAKGTYKPGSTCFLFLKITNNDGGAINSDAITTTIRDSSGDSVETGAPQKAADGYYAYEWAIDAEQAAGDYNISWSYSIDNVEYFAAQEVIVAANPDNVSVMYSARASVARAALENLIFAAQAIPVYYEQAKPSHNQKTFRFTFPHWNQSTGVKIYRNNDIITEGIEIDYFKGEVTFDTTLTTYDMVHADYNFRWFDDIQLQIFINNAVNDFNTFPPYTGYNIGSGGFPDAYLPSILRKAACDALRQLMLSLQFQEPQQVFGGSERAERIFANLETLKKNYEADWAKSSENKAKGPYVGLTQAVVAPTHTLPGSRSRWFRYLFS